MDQPPKPPPFKLTLVPKAAADVAPTTPNAPLSKPFDPADFPSLRDRTAERSGKGNTVGGVGTLRPDTPTPEPFDATNFPRFRDLRRERDAIVDVAGLDAPKKGPQ